MTGCGSHVISAIRVTVSCGVCPTTNSEVDLDTADGLEREVYVEVDNAVDVVVHSAAHEAVQ